MSLEARDLIGCEIDLTIVAGRGLVAKDKTFFGKRTSSDPYVKVLYRTFQLGEKGKTEFGRTPTISKTLDPTWNAHVKIQLAGKTGFPGIKAEARPSWLAKQRRSLHAVASGALLASFAACPLVLSRTWASRLSGRPRS